MNPVTSSPNAFARCRRANILAGLFLLMFTSALAPAQPTPEQRMYPNKLTRVAHPQPILADYPEFVEPVREMTRWEAPALVNEPGGNLQVRAWRFSYNAHGKKMDLPASRLHPAGGLDRISLDGFG